ncbi:MAG TPA: phage holin family protein [Myxococcales bacterium]
MDPTAQQPNVAQVVVGVLDSAQRLVTANLALARAQIEQEARAASRRATIGALAMLPAVVGWALCCLALAVRLSGGLGLVLSLLLVGGLNLGAGVALFVRGTSRRRVA